MQIDLITLLFVLSCFLGSVLFAILFFTNYNNRSSSKILACYLLLFTLFTTHNILLEERWLYHVPHLFRMSRPLHYAVPVLVYLYIRSNIYNEEKFRRVYWLYFIPVVISYVEMAPFYLQGASEKRAYLEQFYANMNIGLRHDEGALPAFVQPVLVFTYGFWLLGRSYVLLKRAKEDSLASNVHDRNQFRWLGFFLWINIVLVLVLLLHMLTFSIIPINTFLLNNIEGAIIHISIGLVLMFTPGILYGFKVQPMVDLDQPTGMSLEEETAEKTARGFLISEEKRLEYIRRINEQIGVKQAFLKKGYTVKMLSEDTEIPYTYLSLLINQEFGLNFNELINSYRVAHVKLLLQQPGSSQYTLEALAEQAGFSSRATFSRAFSRFAGCTPSEYMKKVG